MNRTQRDHEKKSILTLCGNNETSESTLPCLCLEGHSAKYRTQGIGVEGTLCLSNTANLSTYMHRYSHAYYVCIFILLSFAF